MARKRPTFRLIAGPYRAPQCRPGDVLKCRVRGRVVVAGFTDEPVRWPYAEAPGGKRSLVVTGDLVAAVKRESSAAVQWHWGVSRWPVTRWRRALGVERWNEGTAALWSRLWATRLGTEGARKGGLATKGLAKTRRPEHG